MHGFASKALPLANGLAYCYPGCMSGCIRCLFRQRVKMLMTAVKACMAEMLFKACSRKKLFIVAWSCSHQAQPTPSFSTTAPKRWRRKDAKSDIVHVIHQSGDLSSIRGAPLVFNALATGRTMANIA